MFRFPLFKLQNRSLQHQFYNLFLLLIAAILFMLSFPNSFVRYGWGFLSFFVVLPVLLLVHRNSLASLPFWGFLYGMISYLFFNSWLYNFDPVAFFVVPGIYGTYFFIFFPLMKIIMQRYPRASVFLLPMAWTAYEYLRTLGFLGYSFGVLGYAISLYPILIQTSEVFGVWILCLLLVFPSSLLYRCIVERSFSFLELKRRPFLIWSALGYAGFFIIVLIYGVTQQVDYENARTSRVALVQHVMDPWKGGTQTYIQSLQALSELSDTVLQEQDVHLVVWSETAIVPSISYHLRYKEVKEYVNIINDLMRYLKQYPDTYFLIGNGEGKRFFDEQNNPERRDYNAALLFKGAERKQSYYKIHLVPFTEHFPYKRSLPWIYSILQNLDVHFWEAGTEHVVFETDELKFSTPICFEDGFGAQNANFVRGGAELLINISNDAWSQVEVNAMQHLQHSLLRAVENRRSVLRSTNSGMTAAIDPNGKILSMLPSFERGTLLIDVPIYVSKPTFYTRYPDVLAQAILVIISFIVLHAILSTVIRLIRRKKQ